MGKILNSIIDAPYKYNPLSEGFKAIVRKEKARRQTRKNIKHMSNVAAEQATKFKTSPKTIKAVQKRSLNNIQAKARKAYETTKKNLQSQIPKKYR